jgi:NADH-quinone oxidoreductase subunit M
VSGAMLTSLDSALGMGALLVEGAMRANPAIATAIVLTTAVNGIAVMRTYFLLFGGGRHHSTLSLAITTPEWCAALALAVLILGGGLSPQAGVVSRYRAAEAAITDVAAHRAANQTNKETTLPEFDVHD